ncbi:metallophosphoesterase [Yoonia sp. R2331]|uniref:metallophosphoesterase n=1 Tax=Yoonia sp. R2331 TaxID=3237238 RepID=UPI0034E5393A
MPNRLIWLSDLHFTATGDVLGHDPRVRLDAAIDRINAHHADAAYCVISGDMVNRGTDADYAALAAQLGRLTVPVLPMVGNHDDRARLAANMHVPAGLDGFVQYRIDTPDGVIACLDTLDPRADSGAFCAARLGWLTDVLKQGAPTVLFMHHPPMPLGLPMQDQDRLAGGAAFLDAIAGFGNLRHLMIGHVHRPITGVVRGIPFATMRSVLYQAPPPQPAWDWDSFVPAAEAPAMGVVTLDRGAVTLQYHDICAYDVGLS